MIHEVADVKLAQESRALPPNDALLIGAKSETPPEFPEPPAAPKGLDVLAPDQIRRLRFIKALLSVQSAERYLREVIMLDGTPGQLEENTRAQAMAWACITDADRYLGGHNDEILEAAAKRQREEELKSDMLKLGPRANFTVAT